MNIPQQRIDTVGCTGACGGDRGCIGCEYVHLDLSGWLALLGVTVIVVGLIFVLVMT